MDIEKFTERARGFLQAAQTIARLFMSPTLATIVVVPHPSLLAIEICLLLHAPNPRLPVADHVAIRLRCCGRCERAEK